MPTKTAAKVIRERATQVGERLAEAMPDVRCALHHDGPFQLHVATILSAQCTDERVNKVTPELFARLPTPLAFANADLALIEDLVHSTGFFRNKAANIQAAARAILDRFEGEVPGRLEDLVTLAGVGRKTANVVLGECFGIPGITVDTHVGRLSKRLGLTTQDDADKIEQDLMQLVPRPEWTRFSHRVIWHGRLVCTSRKPRCGECVLAALCPSKEGA